MDFFPVLCTTKELGFRCVEIQEGFCKCPVIQQFRHVMLESGVMELLSGLSLAFLLEVGAQSG